MFGRKSDKAENSQSLFHKDSRDKVNYLFKYINPYKYHFFGGLFVLFLSRIIMMTFPYLAGLMIDIAQGKSGMDIELSTLGIVLIGILILQGVISFARVMLFAVVSENALASLRSDVYQKLISLKVYFFEENRVGELISRVTGDIEKLYSILSVTLAEFLGQLVVLIAGIIFLLLTTPTLAGIMLLTFPIIVIGALIFGRFIRKLSKQRQAVLADSNNILSETISAITIVKAFTTELFEIGKYRTSLHKMVRVSLKYAKGRALFSVFIITLLFGALFFIIWRASIMVSDGSLTAGQLISFVSYTALIGGSIASLGSFYTELAGVVGATERVKEILDEESEEVVSENKGNGIAVMGHDIELKDISFAYPSQPDMKVLKGVSMQVSEGQQIAIVGASGAGKSTIMQLLLRFYHDYQGQIFIGGMDVKKISLKQCRSFFGVVPQEVILFAGSIRENIAYGKPNASKDEIYAAAESAYATEFIERFPHGFDTIIGERGMKLSGGQRQRIAIARAILHNPSILLLDEATSSLDAESEQMVQLALENLMQGRTSIVIAHRLATIVNADMIYVLDNGQIIETGNHQELSQIGGGVYASLAHLQFQP